MTGLSFIDKITVAIVAAGLIFLLLGLISGNSDANLNILDFVTNSY